MSLLQIFYETDVRKQDWKVLLYNDRFKKYDNLICALLNFCRQILLVSKIFPVFPSLGVDNCLKLAIDCNLTLKKKQFCTPREGNPGNILLTSRICLQNF